MNNRLSGTFEYYIRENKGMLISMTYPQTLGASAPKTNNGNFQAKGWELSLNWNDKIGDDFKYRVGLTLADAKTEITEYSGAVAIANGMNNKVGASSFIEGKPLNSLYVYKTDGYLQTADEVSAYYTAITQKSGGIHPTQGTSNQLTPGCVKKVDLNADGRITTDDLYYYGDANPHYQFGINLGANYKNFDFSMFIQGVGQQYIAREGQLASPWHHFFLLKRFGGVPIANKVTDTNDDIVWGPRASRYEVTAQILSDLDIAIAKLTKTTVASTNNDGHDLICGLWNQMKVPDL